MADQNEETNVAPQTVTAAQADDTLQADNESQAAAPQTNDAPTAAAATTATSDENSQTTGEQATEEPTAPPEPITYNAVEKDGQVSAIWEMQGRKHIRTIDPRSRQGQEILRLYTTDHHEDAHQQSSDQPASDAAAQ